jgi:hypothetical protein
MHSHIYISVILYVMQLDMSITLDLNPYFPTTVGSEIQRMDIFYVWSWNQKKWINWWFLNIYIKLSTYRKGIRQREQTLFLLFRPWQELSFPEDSIFFLCYPFQLPEPSLSLSLSLSLTHTHTHKLLQYLWCACYFLYYDK